MSDQDVDRGNGGQDTVLGEMFHDQLLILGAPTPEQMLIVIGEETVLCLLTWDSDPGHAAVTQAEAPLGELAAIHFRREVESIGSSITADGRRALVSFVLGEPTEVPGELARSFEAWAGQTRRSARSNRSEASRNRMRARRLRLEAKEIRTAGRSLRHHRPASLAR